VLLESYAGERPHDAEALVAPVREELSARDFTTGQELAKQIASGLSEPGTVLGERQLERVSDLLRRGHQDCLSGQWRKAVEELTRGVAMFLAAPATMVRAQPHRDQFFGALVDLARSHSKLGEQKEAARAMAEVLRTFPSRELSRAEYPPDVHALFRQVARDLRNQGLGRLRINVDAGTMVFVNERLIGLGEVELSDVLPGLYRIYVQQGERRGRVHRVAVEEGGKTAIALRWTLEASLRESPPFVGFEFASEEERSAHEATCAVDVARAVNAPSVAIVGIREHSGRRAIVGVVLSMETGKPIRSGAISVEPLPPSAEKIRALGRFLGGDESAAKLFREDIVAEPPRAPPMADHPGARWYHDKLGWVLFGGGALVALAGGGFLLNASDLYDEADNESDHSRRESLRDRADTRRTTGAVLAVAGGVALIAGVIKLAIPPRKRAGRERSTELVIGPGSIALRGRF